MIRRLEQRTRGIPVVTPCAATVVALRAFAAARIGGNGFRAVGAVAAIERDLDRPVLTANQVLLWAALRAASGDVRGVQGYGRVFSLDPGPGGWPVGDRLGGG